MNEQDLRNQMKTYMNFPKKLFMRTCIGKRDNGTLWGRLAIEYPQHDMSRVPEIKLKNTLRNRGELTGWFGARLIEMNRKTVPLFLTAPKPASLEGNAPDVDVHLGQMHNFRIRDFKHQTELHCDIQPNAKNWDDKYIGSVFCPLVVRTNATSAIYTAKDIVAIPRFYLEEPLDMDRIIAAEFSSVIAGMQQRQMARLEADQRHRNSHQPKKVMANHE